MNFFYDQSASLSTISIYHNSGFSLEDVESVFRPLFESYYGSRQLRSMIAGVDHIWCVYDKRIHRYIASALIESHPDDNTLYVKLFGVAEFSQGQGIGTRLLKAIKRWGRKHRYFAILLHTQLNNSPAIGLYEKVGFRKQYQVANFYRRYGFLSVFETDEPDAYQMILYL